MKKKILFRWSGKEIDLPYEEALEKISKFWSFDEIKDRGAELSITGRYVIGLYRPEAPESYSKQGGCYLRIDIYGDIDSNLLALCKFFHILGLLGIKMSDPSGKKIVDEMDGGMGTDSALQG